MKIRSTSPSAFTLPKQRARAAREDFRSFAFTLSELRERSRAFTLPKLRERSTLRSRRAARSACPQWRAKTPARESICWRKHSEFGVVRRDEGGFTLIELLVVMGMIAILMVLVAPAFTNIKSGSDITGAAYTVKGVLDQARTYAMANNTYTWVGFFEEDGSVPSPAPAGIGRLVMSIVASKDGTMIYTGTLSSPATLPPANLIQVGKLAKIDNLHLKTWAAGSGTGDTFDTRPAFSSTAAQIGNTTPPSPSLTFQYPVGSASRSAQYNFVKSVQFSPRGEGVVDNSNYTFAPVSEIVFQPAHGSAPEPSPVKNPVAVQLTGVGGNVKIYKR